MASHKPHDLQDYTPEELDRMRRRQELRARLKAEFNRYIYDPFRFHHRIELLDPAVQRFMAMRASRYEYFTKPTWAGFWQFFLLVPFPMILLGLHWHNFRKKTEAKLRSGAVPAEDRKFKVSFHHHLQAFY